MPIIVAGNEAQGRACSSVMSHPCPRPVFHQLSASKNGNSTGKMKASYAASLLFHLCPRQASFHPETGHFRFYQSARGKRARPIETGPQTGSFLLSLTRLPLRQLTSSHLPSLYVPIQLLALSPYHLKGPTPSRSEVREFHLVT